MGLLSMWGDALLKITCLIWMCPETCSGIRSLLDSCIILGCHEFPENYGHLWSNTHRNTFTNRLENKLEQMVGKHLTLNFGSDHDLRG